MTSKPIKTMLIIMGLLLITSMNIAFDLDADILMDKVNHRDINGIRRLMMKGINVNAQDTGSGNTALILACGYGYTHIARLLIENGADPNIKNKNGITALMNAAQFSEDLVVLLIEKGADITIKNNDGTTAFTRSIIGAMAGRVTLDVPGLLLEKGAPVDEAPTSGPARGYTSLMMAAKNNDFNVARFLLENGANINHKTMDGETALRLAIEEKHGALSLFFIKKGANIIPITEFKGSPQG